MFAAGFIQGVIASVLPPLSLPLQIIVNILGFFLQLGVIYLGLLRGSDLPMNYRFMFRSFQTNIALRLIGIYIIQFLIFFALSILLLPTIILSGVISGIAVNSSTIAVILAAILFALGVLLIIFFMIRLFFSYAFVLDKGTNSWEAIKLSFKITRGNFWRLLAITFLQLCIMFASGLIIIGLIWTIPLSIIIYGVAYKRMQANLN